MSSLLTRRHAILTPSVVPSGVTNPVLWEDLTNLQGLSAANWATLYSQGVRGAVGVMGGGSYGAAGLPWGPASHTSSEWGGVSAFSSAAPVSGGRFQQQYDCDNAGIAALAHAAGIKIYLGFYLINGTLVSNQPAVMPGDWFNDSTWADWVQTCSDIAGGARQMGFDGIAGDTEGGANAGGFDATWAWNYTGHGANTQAQVNAKALARGQTMMSAIQGAFPSCPLLMYCTIAPALGGAQIPGSYYDNWAAWFNAHQGGSYPAANTSTFYQWLYGMAQNSTSPIILGNALYYDHTNVDGYGPYGSQGSALTNPWGATPNSAFQDDLTGMATGAPGGGAYPSNVSLVPMVWPGSDNSGGGEWPLSAWNGSANAFLQNCLAIPKGKTYLIYTQKNPPVDYSFAGDVGENLTPLNTVSAPPPTWVHKLTGTPSSTGTVSLPSAPPTGDVVFVVGGGYRGSGPAPAYGFSGFGVTSWTHLNASGSYASADIFFGTVGATPTASGSLTGTDDNDQFTAVSFTPPAGWAQDGAAVSAQNSGGTEAPGSKSPAAAGELHIAAWGNAGAQYTAGPTGGWTTLGNLGGGLNDTGLGAWYINPSTTPQNPSAVGGSPWAAIQQAFTV